MFILSGMHERLSSEWFILLLVCVMAEHSLDSSRLEIWLIDSAVGKLSVIEYRAGGWGGGAV